MRIIEHLVEDPHPCAYLPEERARMEVRVMIDVTESDMDAMLQRGWRRFGPMYFRPACEGCQECVSLRVVVDRFAPTKSQRRAQHASRALRRVVGPPAVDAARLALYAKWHANRERERGWASNPHTPERYALEFCFPHPCAREVAYYDGDRLVGLGLFDETASALSAAFFFYDPDYARYSLGTANVVAMVRDAQAAGLAYVYLGYRVAGCASLRYKSAFRAHELLSGRPAPEQQPLWHPGAGPARALA